MIKIKNTLHRLLLVLAAALTLPAGAAQTLLPARSEIAFTSTQMGVPMQGRFGRFGGQIAFDPHKPEAARIAFTIDVASASLGVPELDAELAKSTWFDVKRFPQAQFQGVSAKAGGPGKFDIAGKLTIKGVTRGIVIPVAIAQAAAATTASGAFSIRRLEFGIGDGEWKDTGMVGDEVRVRFKLVLAEQAAK